jgi:AraC-like DNA-binding protein
MNDACRHDVAFGFERFDAGVTLDRHVHASAYAAIVVDGGYEEAGNAGRRRVTQGHVVLHDAFDSHCNRSFRKGSRVFNLPLTRQYAICKWARVADPDAIIDTARRDRREAEAFLLSRLEPVPEPEGDWPDQLCAALRESHRLSLTRWARKHGLARETVSRQFGAIFATTPASFRAEARARSALRDIILSDAPLSLVAARKGFADQAHMTRAIRTLTGRTPLAWRRSHSFKTEPARAS